MPVDVLGEVGRALLGEGSRALEALGRRSEQVERGHRQVAQAGLVVGVGVERLLEEADRGWTLLGDLARPALGLIQQRIGRDDGVDQAPALGGGRVVQTAQVPHLAGAFFAHDAGRGATIHLREEASVHQGNSGDPEVVRCYDDITHSEVVISR